ncbi:MAG: toprim domain-containing protein [Candidatus Omnitrophota bacterium]|jgi:DNA primase
MSKYKIDIQDLKQQIKIIDLAKNLNIQIKNVGGRKMARCINPNHTDEHPSMCFFEDTNRFYCFSCETQGDIIDLYSICQGTSTWQAIQDLSSTYAPGLAGKNNGAYNKPISAPTIKTPPSKHIANIYKDFKLNCGQLDNASIKYLTGPTRGLREEVINKFGIFHIANTGQYNAIRNYLRKKYGSKAVKASGINAFYTFASKNIPFVIVPCYKDGDIEYLWARRIDGINKEPKSLNLTGITMPLFNADILKKLQPNDVVFLCEGIFDAMMLEQNEFNAVAVLGANNYRPELLDQLLDYDVHLCLDNDKQGRKATQDISRYFQNNHGKTVQTMAWPSWAKDVTELFLKEDHYLNTNKI